MKKLVLPASIALMILLAGCTENSKPVLALAGDTSFQRISDEFIQGYLQMSPEAAVGLGFHEYDGKVSDYSKTGLDSQLSMFKRFREKLSNIDTAALSSRIFYDFRILRNEIRKDIFFMEELNPFKTNPMSYAGAFDVSIYVKRNFAPLEDRVRSIIAFEKKAPDVYAAAKANLNDSLAKPFIETAVQIAGGIVSFLQSDLLVALKDVKNDSLMAAFKISNLKTVDEIKNYIVWLQKEKLPKASMHYAIGREKYQQMLDGEMIHLTPEKVLEIGTEELKKEQEQFKAAARIINPNKKAVEVYHDLQKEHPVADSLISDAKKTIESIRQYLIDKNIVTIPSEVRIAVKEMPEFERPTSTASMDAPGPFETKATEAFYYITPVDPKWTAKQKEDWLSQFDYYTTDNVTIHEAYPGHYTQFLHLKASNTSNIEKIFGSYAFVEGWAHYAERMMVDEGYGNTGDSVIAAKHRLAESGDALLRFCRLCVSIKTHCQGISVDEATKFFMDNWYQGDKPSRQEAIRGTFDPGYCFYALGKLEINKLRKDYKQQEGSTYSLKHFHDLMLDNGQPSIRLLREILLKDSTKWNEIL